MSKQNNTCPTANDRLGSTGGQAVLEGVMMRSKTKVALSVRDVNGKIRTEVTNVSSVAGKSKFLRLPLIRGVVGFIDSMALSFRTLSRSAEMLGIEEEESKFEKWLRKHFGKGLVAFASALGTVLGVLLSVGLFMYLPKVLSNFAVSPEAAQTSYGMALLKSFLQGLLRILIFLLYIKLVSLIPDMKRTFMYHGAEHKSIFCHEKYEPLTVENVRKQSRFHPRCGTSFLVVMMVIGILVSVPFANQKDGIYVLLKLCTLPVVVALGYEFIRYAGRHDNLFVRIVSAPGLWVQRITTLEPDDSMIEVAIRSLKASLPEVYPEIVEELRADKETPADTETPETDGEQSSEEGSSETPETPSDTSEDGGDAE